MTQRVCDNCKRPSEPFDLDTGETAYWFRVQKDDDPTVLMSDFNFAFCCTTDPEPEPENEGEKFWCVRCIEAIAEEEPE